MGCRRPAPLPIHLGTLLPRSQRHCVPRLRLYACCINNDRFVVDAADQGKLEMARNELRNLLEKPMLNGIPILVLGNKNDLPNALTAEQLIDKLYSMIPYRCFTYFFFSGLATISTQEVSCYSISAKNKVNIDITIQWLIRQAKKGRDARTA